MKKLTTYYLTALTAVLISCSSQDDILGYQGQEELIQVSVGVGDDSASTRTTSGAIPYKGTTPTDENPLAANVWFGTDGSAFPEGSAGTLPRRISMSFTSGSLTFPPEVLKYPDSGNVYAVGLYPQSGWSPNVDNTTVTYTLDGNTDVMFADMVTADKVNKFNSSTKRLQFNHLLTWVMVRVCASDFEAPTSWGNITSVKIETAQDLTVALGTGVVSYNVTTQDITVYDDPTGVPLQTTAVDIGEKDASGELKGVFLAPATSYTVKVETANVSPDPITVNLQAMNGDPVADATTTKGKVYVLTLYFNKFHLIDATCTLTDWDDDYGIIYGNVS